MLIKADISSSVAEPCSARGGSLGCSPRIGRVLIPQHPMACREMSREMSTTSGSAGHCPVPTPGTRDSKPCRAECDPALLKSLTPFPTPPSANL